ncbi:DUF3857 domain-containing protein [Rhodocytophaga aerolata]|uniref:DUF3857 domain-containing protein n=1 Tax=Rhodocytophaga aerolata TaxID=455078 RepID=A0ABT8R4M4_9BACT|nr:DUF3857 domain-containing protein [Rhodocytophaga aerolata]MDO1446188.1 DUF3857 domain-containing protein [Rhodocytophaga aerolata]
MFNIKSVSLLLFVCSYFRVMAGDGNYAVSSIPAKLLENAYAVQRMEEITFTVKSPGEATKKTRYAITILNEKGKKYAKAYVGYDKLVKVNNLQGSVYDAQGKLVSKLKKADTQDVSAVSDNSLFEDNRMKIAAFSYSEYPYTVEFEYETTSKNTLFYPVWTPQGAEHYAVEQSMFTVIMPKNLKLRYKEVNINQKVSLSSVENNTIYTWQIANLPVFEVEPLSAPATTLLPIVYTAPTDFEVEGYQGNMSSWQELGKWQHKLNEGRDVLPESVKQKLQQLTARETDKAKKVKKIYEYLQANTRYVSIQLGIGGWQSFEASLVADKGYGDCKALSNYTKAMLKSVGVESYFALIKAGDDEQDIATDFPTMQFNHVILCVPVQKDTIWLECTDQTKPFGYMGGFTGNRHALLITSEGGKLVKTPSYTAKDNLQHRKAEVVIAAHGDATAEITSVYTGQQQDMLSQMIYAYGPEEQKKMLYKSIKIPSYEINSFTYTHTKERVPAVSEKVVLNIRKCASKSGSRIFLTPNLLSAISYVPPVTENRRSAVVLPLSYIDTDTIRYHVPEGFHPEFLPETIHYKSAFGEYTASIVVDRGIILYIRKFTMNRGTYPAASYNELVEFRKKVAKADKTQIVLVNKS